MATECLDLDDPVLVVVDFLNTNFSAVPVEVLTGYTRGGYSGIKPDILPVEGEAGKIRKRTINVKALPAKSIVYIYEASENETETTINENFADDKVRISIDIFHGESRVRLKELYNEIRRIVMKVKKDPGGNYSFVKRLSRVDLTNRSTGIWRYVIDIELVKVSDFIGHV